MKYFLALFCCAIAACAPSPTESTSTMVNTGAEYKANVSTLYSLGTTSGYGIDVQWRDSNGVVQKLSDYAGKAVVLSFGTTSDASSQAQYASLDSLASTMPDSVRCIAIAQDNIKAAHSFQIVSDYAKNKGIRLQMIVDSTKSAQVQFSQLGTDRSLYTPETFVLKPNGSLSTYFEGGPFYMASLQQDVRNAYK